MPKNYCIMQIWAESGKSALPICNYSQILYQFLTFTQNLKRSLVLLKISRMIKSKCTFRFAVKPSIIIEDLNLQKKFHTVEKSP